MCCVNRFLEAIFDKELMLLSDGQIDEAKCHEIFASEHEITHHA